jgi:hypothetical protein
MPLSRSMRDIGSIVMVASNGPVMDPPAASLRFCNRNKASDLRRHSLIACREARLIRLVLFTERGAGRSSTTAQSCCAGGRSTGLSFSLKRGTPFSLSPLPCHGLKSCTGLGFGRSRPNPSSDCSIVTTLRVWHFWSKSTTYPIRRTSPACSCLSVR